MVLTTCATQESATRILKLASTAEKIVTAMLKGKFVKMANAFIRKLKTVRNVQEMMIVSQPIAQTSIAGETVRVAIHVISIMIAQQGRNAMNLFAVAHNT